MSEASPGKIRRFFSFLGKAISALRSFLINTFFVVIVIGFVVVLTGTETETLPESGALVIAPEGVLVEQRSYVEPALLLLDPGSAPSEVPLHSLIGVIDQAADDDGVPLLLLQLDDMTASLPMLTELAAAIERFKAKGKRVVTYSRYYGQHQYFLASYADEVILHPYGLVDVNGYSIYSTYFADALKKLGVEMQVFKVGNYKSAVEPYTRNDMSDFARENLRRWVNPYWGFYQTAVAANRGLEPTGLDDFINTKTEVLTALGGDSGQLALNAKLVDNLMTEQQLISHITSLVGADGDSFAQYSYSQYRGLPLQLKATADLEENLVGVVVLEGNIVDGFQPPGVAGGDSVAELLKQAKDDDGIGAVVFRISSGGGSAFASEIIREQVEALQAAGKPVVVSMSNAAASGGYWVAAGADAIFANENTITGSIGIFGIVPSIEKTLADWGVHSDGITTHENGSAYSVARSLNEHTKQQLTEQLKHGYNRFIGLVSEGRDMPIEQVEKIAQGQIWLGSQALNNGLVDNIGGLREAIQEARVLADLPEDSKVRWVRDARMEQIETLAILLESVSLPVGKFAGWTKWLNAAPNLNQLTDPSHRYLTCFDCVDVISQ